jgi:hypothetical protein
LAPCFDFAGTAFDITILQAKYLQHIQLYV